MRSRHALSAAWIALDRSFFSGSALSKNRSMYTVSPNLTYACDLYGCSVSRSNCPRYTHAAGRQSRLQ